MRGNKFKIHSKNHVKFHNYDISIMSFQFFAFFQKLIHLFSFTTNYLFFRIRNMEDLLQQIITSKEASSKQFQNLKQAAQIAYGAWNASSLSSSSVIQAYFSFHRFSNRQIISSTCEPWSSLWIEKCLFYGPSNCRG